MIEEPETGEDDVFFDDEAEGDRQQRQLNNYNRRRPSNVHDESPWHDNVEQAYEDSLSNLDPID